MLYFIKRYFTNPPLDVYESFIDDIINYIYKKLKVQKTQLSEIKIYYNEDIFSCIVRMKFDERYVKGMSNEYYYFLVNCFQSEINTYGQSFEECLSDNGKKITWIHENKILKFYPEQTLINMISKRLESI